MQVRLPLAKGPVWAAWVLLATNVIIYLLSLLLSLLLVPGGSGSLLSPNWLVLFLMGWKDNVQIFFEGEYWRFLTSMFLHGGLMHILSNGFALYVLGPDVERIYGTPRFLTLYFLSGLAGGVASYAFSSSPSVGASGAIFGLIGGLAVFLYITRHILGEMGRNQLQYIAIIIGINVLIGFSSGGVIDNYAHLGGLAGGALCGWLLSPRYRVEGGRFAPAVVREMRVWGWAGVLGFAALLGMLMWIIQPPVALP